MFRGLRGLIGSEVLRIAGEVRALVAAGQPVCNLTVGDFDAREFPAPPRLLSGITRALAAGHTNYPPSNGVLELRQAIARFYRRELDLEYPVESVLVADLDSSLEVLNRLVDMPEVQVAIAERHVGEHGAQQIAASFGVGFSSAVGEPIRAAC